MTTIQPHYWVIKDEKSKRPILTNAQVPIYWNRKVAKKESEKFKGTIVEKIVIDFNPTNQVDK